MFNIEIKEGRRPGKVIRKKAPKGFGEDFSAIVESLKYEVEEVVETYDWNEALISCNSCQSKNKETRELFRKVWGNIPKVSFINMFEKTTGNVVARCLINKKKKTHAPVYGEKHFLLESRLKFFGFEKGELVPTDVLENEVKKQIKNSCNYSKDFPKSEIETKTEILSPLSEQEQESIVRLKKNLLYYTQVRILISDYDGFLKREIGFFALGKDLNCNKGEWRRSKRVISGLIKETAVHYNALYAKDRRYKKHCKKQGKKYGNKIKIEYKLYHPISNQWEWEEEKKEYKKTSLFNDYERGFVSVQITKREGWYKNENV